MEPQQVPPKSLPVPFVQEIAIDELTTVPSRYVRVDQDPPFPTTDDSCPPPSVPVIDMHKLLSPESMDSELEKLHNACKDWGFFQLINHGVSLSLVERVKSEVQDLFNLPMNEKKKYCQRDGNLEGFGQAFVVSEEQKLDWADLFLLSMLPIHSRDPHLFPKLPQALRNTLEDYSTELVNLAKKMIKMMAKAMKIESSYITQLFEEGSQDMRMNHYPPCPQPEIVMGLSAHTDAVGLTVVIQSTDTEGLQIKKDGKWVPIKFLPDAFVINVGDVIEIVTNGIYRSIEHRAVINSVKERLSIATFYSPRLEAELGPDPNLVSPETPALFRRITFGDYSEGYLSRELSGKSYIDTIRIYK